MGTPLTCSEARRRLEEAVVEDLGEKERRELEAHLAICPSCAAAWRWERLFHRAAKEWPLPEPSPPLARRIMARLGQEGGMVMPWAERVAVGALVVLSLVMLAEVWWVGQGHPSWLPPLEEFLRRMGQAFNEGGAKIVEGGRRWWEVLLFLWRMWEEWSLPWASLAPLALLALLALQGWGIWRMRGMQGIPSRQ